MTVYIQGRFAEIEIKGIAVMWLGGVLSVSEKQLRS